MLVLLLLAADAAEKRPLPPKRLAELRNPPCAAAAIMLGYT